MLSIITAEEMKELEEICEKGGFSRLQLMENAGFEIAEQLILTYKAFDKHFFFICGTGNNGGDGLAAARLLISHPVMVGLTGDKSRMAFEASIQYRKLNRHKIILLDERNDILKALKNTTANTILVDALIGTGIKGRLRHGCNAVIKAFNRSKGRKVSIDIPSGIDPDTGKSCGEYINPECIIALHDEKPGLKRFKGKVIIRPIGIPGWALREFRKRHYSKK